MSWNDSFSKLKGIAKKEKMRRTDDYSSNDYFRCTKDYSYLHVSNYGKMLRVYWIGDPYFFFGDLIKHIKSQFEKIGVEWEKKRDSDGWEGTYRHEGQTIFIELREKRVEVYVKK